MRWNSPKPIRDAGPHKKTPFETGSFRGVFDVNHGFAKTPVINSEVAKKREALQKRLDNVRRWAVGARTRMRNASKLYMKRCQPDL